MLYLRGCVYNIFTLPDINILLNINIYIQCSRSFLILYQLNLLFIPKILSNVGCINISVMISKHSEFASKQEVWFQNKTKNCWKSGTVQKITVEFSYKVSLKEK